MSIPDPYRLPESANPYAPPELDLVELRRVSTLPGAVDFSGPYDISTVIANAFDAYKQQFGIALGVAFGGLGLNYALSIANAYLLTPLFEQSSPLVMFSYQLSSTIFVFLFQIWITLGQSIAFLNIARGREAHFQDLFRGGPYFLRYGLASILYGLVFIAIASIAAIPIGLAVWLGREGDPTIMIVVILGVGLAALIAFMIASIRISQYTYALIDRDCGPLESLQFSIAITRGRALPVFATLLLAGLIGFAGVLACFVGFIFSYPLSMIILSSVYLALIGHRPDGSKPLRRDLDFLDAGL